MEHNVHRISVQISFYQKIVPCSYSVDDILNIDLFCCGIHCLLPSIRLSIFKTPSSSSVEYFKQFLFAFWLMPQLFSLKYLVFSNNWKVLALAGTSGTNPAIHNAERLETAFLKIHSYFRGSCVVMYFKVCKTVHIILNYMTPWISSWWYAVVKKMMSDETKLIWKKKFHLITMPFVVFKEQLTSLSRDVENFSLHGNNALFTMTSQ